MRSFTMKTELQKWYELLKCHCRNCQVELFKCENYMAICPECGDKRCPRADDHRNDCRQGGTLL